ncbi:DegT/DnrJ/EryC1/StrS family aminotransferase [Caenimonas sedimenti]|uniref:DegT/DnrJ/EryC1/StrS family aminotransferase n=1 Tax=Caenimonas sedimenti TaxID=2596921 RepID=A0A562ZWG4_9BURK|nr:DegT/DnrJ/EryC1/StrS family aminotransferase [Caenimonas sedimenti]TWO72514.1 DegT/DnrJ/EryC1/StrS family aminotransferase [Caenimonas sedimenti]
MPFTDLRTQYEALRAGIHARMDRVLEHGQYILGPEVAELEEALRVRVGVRHCVTVGSGTDALLIALMALGVGPGDEVITTPFTFAATAEMIVIAGATPVFADVEPDTCNIDAKQVERLITPRTKCIMPVSLYGQVADMEELNAIAARHGLAVIEDAAQSFGASFQGRPSCGLSTFGCTSFFPSKPLGCYGDGGALFTDDDALAQAAREIRVHGQSKRYTHTRLGIAGRMDTLQCAIVLAKLERFDWEIARRKILGDQFRQRLQAAGAPVDLLAVRPDRDCVWGQFTVLAHDRAGLQQLLQEAGIPNAVHYPIPLTEQPVYRQYASAAGAPVAAAVAQRVLSLPFSADLTEQAMEQVVSALKAKATA